jgi:hypothetical protein
VGGRPEGPAATGTAVTGAAVTGTAATGTAVADTAGTAVPESPTQCRPQWRAELPHTVRPATAAAQHGAAL